MILLLKFYPFFRVSVSGECRKFHSEDELGLYFSQNVFQVIKLSVSKLRIRQVWGKLRVRNNLENLGVDGRIISNTYRQKVGWKDVYCTDLD
jgi:hypothetical protein